MCCRRLPGRFALNAEAGDQEDYDKANTEDST
jgi:hypothetical protein